MRRVFEQSDANHLTIREYSKDGNYNKSVIKRRYDTWNEACKAAGIPHGLKHGRPRQGPNGEHLASQLEYLVASALDEQGLEYVPHKPIPETRWKCDFYVPKLSLWIEADGYLPGQRPNQATFDEKLRYYDRRIMKFAIVTDSSEMEEKVFQRS